MQAAQSVMLISADIATSIDCAVLKHVVLESPRLAKSKGAVPLQLKDVGQLPGWGIATCSAGSAALAAWCTHPADVVKTRLQVGVSANQKETFSLSPLCPHDPVESLYMSLFHLKPVNVAMMLVQVSIQN